MHRVLKPLQDGYPERPLITTINLVLIHQVVSRTWLLVTKGTINTGTKSASKPTDLEEFHKTTQQIIIIIKKSKHLHAERKASLQKFSVEKDSIHGSLSGARHTTSVSKRRRWNTAAGLDSQYLAAHVSRAALRTAGTRGADLPYLEAAEEKKLLVPAARRIQVTIPVRGSAGRGAPGQAVRGSSSRGAACFGHQQEFNSTIQSPRSKSPETRCAP